jgi:hypothetical protein
VAARAMSGELNASAAVLTTLHTAFRSAVAVLLLPSSTRCPSLELDSFLHISCCLVLSGVAAGLEETRARCA